MNFRNSTAGDLLCVSFNQDHSCFACGTENGFFICDTDPLQERFRREFDGGGIGLVEMLFRCNILALVGGGRNPKNMDSELKATEYDLRDIVINCLERKSALFVLIWDDFQVQCIAELEFRSEVKGVRLRRDRIIVILETKLYIYNFVDLKLIDQIDTYPNPTGLGAVSAAKDDMIMACLGEKVGEVRIDLYSRNQTKIISAHNNPISQLCLNLSGTRLATASERGTLVRIFDTQTGKKLKEFRRGAGQASIQSLAFNKTTTALCLTSDKGTIHIYSLIDAMGDDNRSSSLSFMKNVVPYLGSTWSSKQFSVNETHCVSVFGPETKNGKSSVIVLGSSGNYYKYSYLPEQPECIEEVRGLFVKMG